MTRAFLFSFSVAFPKSIRGLTLEKNCSSTRFVSPSLKAWSASIKSSASIKIVWTGGS